MTDVQLTLLGEPELEEKLLDELLLHPAAPTFVSQRVASHGGHPAEMSAGEQVLGRADAVLVQALLEPDGAQRLLADLGRRFAGSGLRYWLTPVLSGGQL